MTDAPLPRRRVLAGLGSLGLASIAGCNHSPENDSGTASPTADAGPIESVGFAGQDLVVGLHDDHAVERLNLIDPAGSTYRQATVAKGATTVRLQILDINDDVGGYEHYDPGTYELVAVHDGASTTQEIELRPSLEIVDVEQYRDGKSRSLTKLEVEVKNTGPAPTWVHEIQYQNAPYPGANVRHDELASVPQITSPRDEAELIVEAGGSQTYVGILTPFAYSSEDLQNCEGQIEMTVLVVVPYTDFIEQDIKATLGGNVEPTGYLDHQTCNEISVQLSDQRTVTDSLLGGD